MLSISENKKASLMNIETVKNVDYLEILNLEKKYNKNSLEILNLKENLTADLIKWQLLLEKLIYLNEGFYKINKINPVTYITYPKNLSKKRFTEYLDLVQKYCKDNPNTIFILSNSCDFYKKILGGLNHREIITILLTNNKEDLYLDYTNTIIQYSDNIKKNALSFKPKVIKYNFGEVI